MTSSGEKTSIAVDAAVARLLDVGHRVDRQPMELAARGP